MEQTDSGASAPHKKGEEIRISRRTVIIGSIVVSLLLLLLLMWQFGGFSAIGRLVAPANAQIAVTDKSTGKPIPQVVVMLQDKIYRTNDQGITEIKKLQAGKEYTLKISSPSYITVENKLRLKRGNNSLSFQLEVNQIKTTLQGIITDYVSEEPIGEVKVTTSSGTATSATDGIYSIPNVPVGPIEITLEKSGFEKKTASETLEEEKAVNLTLVRPDKVVFVSNRDKGKRGIYSSSYDGTNTAQIVKRVDDTEDFSLQQSPDGKKIAFLSTRDKRKREGDAQSYEPSLYTIDTDGKNLSLISKDFFIGGINWSSNNQHLAWTARSASSDSAEQLFTYTFSSKQQTKMNESGSVAFSTFNHSGTAIAWTQSSFSGSPDAKIGVFYREIGKIGVKEIDTQSAGELQFSEDDKSIRYSYFDEAENKSKYVQYTISNGTKSTYTPTAGTTSTKIISPDKSKYAYIVARDGKSDVYLSDTSGKNEKRLTQLGTAIGEPQWSQDSRYILFDSYQPAETAKYVVSTNGKPAKKVTDIYLEGAGRGF